MPGGSFRPAQQGDIPHWPSQAGLPATQPPPAECHVASLRLGSWSPVLNLQPGGFPVPGLLSLPQTHKGVENYKYTREDPRREWWHCPLNFLTLASSDRVFTGPQTLRELTPAHLPVFSVARIWEVQLAVCLCPKPSVSQWWSVEGGQGLSLRFSFPPSQAVHTEDTTSGNIVIFWGEIV